jgi:hypothetical protein
MLSSWQSRETSAGVAHAQSEAEKRWGDHAEVRTDGRACVVGVWQRPTGLVFIVRGRGGSWREAFEAADAALIRSSGGSRGGETVT